MQVLKEEIKEKIRLSAMKEFKEKGFEGTSMRAIAKQAGISVGNLYRYYDNKQSLFEYIVEPVVNKMRNMSTQHHMQFEFLDINILEHLDFIANSIISARNGKRDELYILLEKSKGSHFENTKQILIEMLEKQFNDNLLPEVNKKKEIVKGKVFIKALATCAVEGVCTILRECEDERDFIENMVQYMEFTFKSILRTLIGMRDETIKLRRLSDEEISNRFNNFGCYERDSST